jgi:hypothetical protein
MAPSLRKAFFFAAEAQVCIEGSAPRERVDGTAALAAKIVEFARRGRERRGRRREVERF